MIDRSYLPFKSARDYQDLKMAKWLDFFLSEHSSALSQDEPVIDYSRAMPFNDKLRALRQLFTQQLLADFEIVQDQELLQLTGKITQFQDVSVGISGQHAYHFVAIKDILSINLHGEVEDNG